jgi:hypothetical protein
MRHSIWIGFDLRQAAAFAVAKHSVTRRLNIPVPVFAVDLQDVRQRGLYHRPTRTVVDSEGHARLWDDISETPMSTEFAISRFLTPLLARTGWALFMDCDMLARVDVSKLFLEYADRSSKALLCVQHAELLEVGEKMDHQLQVPYARKNWSSVMLFNCEHPANRALGVDLINRVPGRDLHRFCWLDDKDIGEIPLDWNWLVGHSPPLADPKLVHFTDGFPLIPGYEQQPYADEWRAELRDWAHAGRWEG